MGKEKERWGEETDTQEKRGRDDKETEKTEKKREVYLQKKSKIK